MVDSITLTFPPAPPVEAGRPGSVVALFVKDGQVLSVTRRNKPGDLSLVGGSIDDKDRLSPEDRDYQVAYRALVREVAEETGVVVKKAQWVFERVDETDGKIAWCYQIHEWEGEPKTVEPGVEVSWRRPEELLAANCTFRDYNVRLFRAMDLVR
jgi:8-oxo-dGTP pyrophosphatase MutT (NUDIX family)